MKKLLFTVIILLFNVIAIAQTKPKSTDKPPTKKEMDDMMKQAQKEMDNLSPEDKKMMEAMGIKLPDTKAIKKAMDGMSDKQIKTAVENDNRIVPLKDIARINKALAVKLTTAQMSQYISETHRAVLTKLSPVVKAKALEISQQLNASKKSVGNTAVGFWIDGKPTLALYLMGEACKADITDDINLNNYASFLTMCGAEQLAIPILNNLNTRYPKNTSILNNITQAWLGLGDVAKAEKYADSTLRLFANHSQANMAKCLIEESKGNIPKAIESAKRSIRTAYTNEKERKLKKLGYKLRPEDVNWHEAMPQDALGLAKFTWPEYPMKAEENAQLEKEWNDFKALCQAQIDQLKAKQERLEKEYINLSALRNQQIMQASQQGLYAQPMPVFTAKAMIKLGPSVSDVLGNSTFIFANEFNKVLQAKERVTEYENSLIEKQKGIDQKYKNLIGEGKANPFEAICKDENGIRSAYLTTANSDLRMVNQAHLKYTQRKINDLLYYYQYTTWPEQFELFKVYAQIAWLTLIKDQPVAFKAESSYCTNTIAKASKAKPLQNFDDVACKYVSVLDMGVYKIVSTCSNLTGAFDFGGVKIDVTSNIETGKYAGSAEVGIKKGYDGPKGSKTEVEVSATGLLEWDNTGITNVGAVVGVDGNIDGHNIAGIEITATINSGVSTTGKGILSGI